MQNKNLSPEVQNIIQAIQLANQGDEKKIIDDILKDVRQNRSRYFDFLYIDLSIDRSIKPLEISGTGTYLTAAQATDDLANVTVAFEYATDNTGERITLKEGKSIDAPFNKLYIYHSAQSGKTMTLMRAFNLPSLRIGISDQSGESANSDLNTALGNSSTYSTGQQALNGTAALVKAANTSRRRITIKCPEDAAVPVFIGLTSGVTTSTGHRLGAGDAITLNSTAAIYAITAGTAVTVTYLEE